MDRSSSPELVGHHIAKVRTEVEVLIEIPPARRPAARGEDRHDPTGVRAGRSEK